MARFRLEWQYENGKTHWTYANSEEMVTLKAQPLIENDKIVCVRSYEVINKKILKDPMDYMISKGIISKEETDVL